MFGLKAKRIAQLEAEIMSLVENDLLREQVIFELRRELKQTKQTLDFVLHAPLPAVVKGKRRVSEVINTTLLKRAHSHQ